MSEKRDVCREDVEKYLDTHQDIAVEIFAAKATPELVDGWLSKHSVGHVSKSMSSHEIGSWPDVSACASNTEKHKMLHSLRKSFAGASGSLRSLLSPRKRKIVRRNKSALRQLDEKDLFMELIRDIADELDLHTLSHKILMNVSILTNGDRCSLFLARGNRENRYLVSKLFDVTENSTVEDALHTEADEIHIPFGQGIAGHVAQTKETINIKNAYEDPRFNPEVDKRTGYRTYSILCMPIINHEGDVIGVAQVINKVSGSHEFTNKDEEVFRNYLTFCGIGIMNAQLFEMSVNEYKRNQMLLQLARGIFEEQTSLESVVHKIMKEAITLLKCERCLVFLLEDHDKSEFHAGFSKAFDLMALKKEEIKQPSDDMLKKSVYSEIAKYVALTGKTINIEKFDTQTKFKLIYDADKNFRLHTLLCQPIYNSQNKIVGVAEMINKTGTALNPTFTDQDENLFEAFAIFCGLGIHNTQMYESAVKLMAKQQVALEVLSYHATAQQDEVEKLKQAGPVESTEKLNLQTFAFSDFTLVEDETLQASICMFEECNLINKFHIPYDVLCRWLLSVRKNYRPVIYHNWRHAFNVAQTMFAMFKTGGMSKVMSDLEAFALLVACLCHDLDHRGTNNAFQLKTASALSQLYSTSTMEHHHFDHCIMILNSEGNNIFQFLSPEDYRELIRMLEGAILSTDLALYFKKRNDFFKLVEQGVTDWEEPKHKDLLRGMMMTACDVSAITKPWEVQRRVAELVASEFFEQGDMEREQLKEEPIAMMDRRKKSELPKMQVGFIDAICMPVYKNLATLQPQLAPLHDGVQHNRSQWQQLADTEAEAHKAEEAQKAEEAKKKRKASQDPGKERNATAKDEKAYLAKHAQEEAASTSKGVAAAPTQSKNQKNSVGSTTSNAVSNQCKEALAPNKNRSSFCVVV
ncbi:cGMP-specific 3',5'-cyclic phosphodiesterase-like isoform X4 [Patiria miniata]|uniref:Phosphodiesterase n=1 Tax=Patiria miniata TaxID=46514 RepID=A0A913Z753_PATMI|nr:cGMP-specific 3',5'-cyclic phosphodiesterase-like isoform X4 [Patiria miniata]